MFLEHLPATDEKLPTGSMELMSDFSFRVEATEVPRETIMFRLLIIILPGEFLLGSLWRLSLSTKAIPKTSYIEDTFIIHALCLKHFHSNWHMFRSFPSKSRTCEE